MNAAYRHGVGVLAACHGLSLAVVSLVGGTVHHAHAAWPSALVTERGSVGRSGWLREPPGEPGAVSRVTYLDGTYELTLPPTLAHPVDFTDDSGITWSYDGQERLDGAGPAAAGEEGSRRARVWRDDREVRSLSLVENLRKTVSVDRYGRRWRPVAIENGALRARIEAYDEAHADEERVIRAPTSRTERRSPFVGWAPPDVLLFAESRTGYTGVDCDGDGQDDQYTWGYENRDRAEPMDSRDDKTVYLRFRHSSGGQGSTFCSGTLVDENSVLTNAHCLYTSRGVQRDFSGADRNSVGVACTRENLQAGAECAVIDRISRPGGYDTDDDPIEYDYALVHLDENLGKGNYMAISKASAGTHTSSHQDTTGSPHWWPYAIVDGGCRTNIEANGRQDRAFVGRYAYTQRLNDDTTWVDVGDIFDAGSWYATQADVTAGQSGSGVWYYPSSSSHYLTMILSRYAYWWFEPYAGGPRAQDFRSWAIANM